MIPLLTSINAKEQMIIQSNLKLLGCIGVAVGPNASSYEKLKKSNRDFARTKIELLVKHNGKLGIQLDKSRNFNKGIYCQRIG